MKINTVTGPVDVTELGATLIHEHVICSSPEFMQAFYPRWNNPEKVLPNAVSKLKYIKEKHGVKTIVDGTPLSLGRDLELLKRVSEESGVYIIASTGFYTGNCFTVQSTPAEILADWLIDEIVNGPVKPSFLKCAVETPLDSYQERVFHVLALVMKATGLPVFAHSRPSIKTGLQILDEFAKHGIPMNKIIVGHSADSLDLEYNIELLNRGAYVSIDRLHRNPSCLEKARLAAELIRRGWANKLFFAHDGICHQDYLNCMTQEHSSEPVDRLAVLHDTFLPCLRENGIQEDAIDTILVKNLQTLFE